MLGTLLARAFATWVPSRAARRPSCAASPSSTPSTPGRAARAARSCARATASTGRSSPLAGRRGARLPRHRGARRRHGRPDERRTGRRLAHLPLDRRRRDVDARAHQPRQGRLLRRDRVLGRAERRRHRRPGQRHVFVVRTTHDGGATWDDARRPRPARRRSTGEGAFAASGTCLTVAQGRQVRLVRHRRRAGLARLPHEQIAASTGTRRPTRSRRQRVVGPLLGRVPRRAARLRRRRRLQAAAVRRLERHPHRGRRQDLDPRAHLGDRLLFRRRRRSREPRTTSSPSASPARRSATTPAAPGRGRATSR